MIWAYISIAEYCNRTICDTKVDAQALEGRRSNFHHQQDAVSHVGAGAPFTSNGVFFVFWR